MDFRATVNCDVTVHCPTQNASQNNLSGPVSPQTLLSHSTDTSYVIFPEIYNVSNFQFLSVKRTKEDKKEAQNSITTLEHEILRSRSIHI